MERITNETGTDHVELKPVPEVDDVMNGVLITCITAYVNIFV